MTIDRVLRMSEAARRLGVTRRTVLRYVHEGKLPAVQLPSGHYRVRETDLAAAIEERGRHERRRPHADG